MDPAVARFAERLIEATPIDVVAEFYPAFTEHDKTDGARRASREMPVLVLAGDKDLVTPSAHSEAIADLLPDAELVIVPDAGHLVMLEHPEVVNGPPGRPAGPRSGAGAAQRLPLARLWSSTAAAAASRAHAGPSRRAPQRRALGAAHHRHLARADAGAGPPARQAAAPRRSGAAHRRAGRGQDDADPRASARASACAAPSPRPTFVIARVHPSLGDGPPLVHVDAYRLGGGLDEMEDLDLDVSLPESVVVVEWGEGKVEELSDDRLHVRDPPGGRATRSDETALR